MPKYPGFDKKEQKGGGWGDLEKSTNFCYLFMVFPHKSARIWTLVLKFLNLFDEHFLVDYDVGIHLWPFFIWSI